MAHVGEELALGETGGGGGQFGGLANLDFLAQLGGALLDETGEVPLAAPQLAHAQAIDARGGGGQGQGAESVEPGGLIVARLGQEGERSSGLVPDAVVVASDYAEAERARGEIGVESGAPRAGVHPIGVKALQPVAEAHLIGEQVTEGGVMELEIAARADRGAIEQGPLPLVGYALDQNRRDAPIGFLTPGFDFENPSASGEAERARGSFPSRGRAEGGEIAAAAEAVGGAQHLRVNGGRAPFGDVVQPGAGNPQQAGTAGEP